MACDTRHFLYLLQAAENGGPAGTSTDPANPNFAPIAPEAPLAALSGNPKSSPQWDSSAPFGSTNFSGTHPTTGTCNHNHGLVQPPCLFPSSLSQLAALQALQRQQYMAMLYYQQRMEEKSKNGGSAADASTSTETSESSSSTEPASSCVPHWQRSPYQTRSSEASDTEEVENSLEALFQSEDDDSTDFASFFGCLACGKEFPSKLKLKLHQHSHSQGGIFKCDWPNCSVVTSSFSQYIFHRQAQHKIKPFVKGIAASVPQNAGLENENTDQFFRAKASNCEMKTSSGKKPFKCNYPGCSSIFQSYSGLKYHKLLHSGTKDYKCDWPNCNSAFTNSSGLKIHRMTHEPESKAWKCDWNGCKAAFTTSSALSTHVRTHTGAKPYKCTWGGCDKSFARADHLKIHTRSHTNERPYICKDCGKGFTNSSGLRTHEKTHARNAPAQEYARNAPTQECARNAALEYARNAPTQECARNASSTN